MLRLRLTLKRQLTFSEDILKHLGAGPGATVDIDLLPDATIQIRAEPKGRISDAFGSLKQRGQRRLSIKEIGEIAVDGWAGKR